jgi:hypothetical protein
VWSDQPGEQWYQDSLPIANGYMGALIRGQIGTERIPLNEETIWSGGPGESAAYQGGNRPGAYEFLAPVRELLRKGQEGDSGWGYRGEDGGASSISSARADMPCLFNLEGSVGTRLVGLALIGRGKGTEMHGV